MMYQCIVLPIIRKEGYVKYMLSWGGWVGLRDFSYWAWSKPWGHVLSLKSFCRNPVLSWAIRYSVFQPVKFAISFKRVCSELVQLKILHLICIKRGVESIKLESFELVLLSKHMHCTLLTSYRVHHGKVGFLNWLWQIEIYKLDFVWRYLYIPEFCEFEFHQPVFKKVT